MAAVVVDHRVQVVGRAGMLVPYGLAQPEEAVQIRPCRLQQWEVLVVGADAWTRARELSDGVADTAAPGDGGDGTDGSGVSGQAQHLTPVQATSGTGCHPPDGTAQYV